MVSTLTGRGLPRWTGFVQCGWCCGAVTPFPLRAPRPSCRDAACHTSKLCPSARRADMVRPPEIARTATNCASGLWEKAWRWCAGPGMAARGPALHSSLRGMQEATEGRDRLHAEMPSRGRDSEHSVPSRQCILAGHGAVVHVRDPPRPSSCSRSPASLQYCLCEVDLPSPGTVMPDMTDCTDCYVVSPWQGPDPFEAKTVDQHIINSQWRTPAGPTMAETATLLGQLS
jgi:hypothetical protein